MEGLSPYNFRRRLAQTYHIGRDWAELANGPTPQPEDRDWLEAYRLLSVFDWSSDALGFVDLSKYNAAYSLGTIWGSAIKTGAVRKLFPEQDSAAR